MVLMLWALLPTACALDSVPPPIPYDTRPGMGLSVNVNVDVNLNNLPVDCSGEQCGKTDSSPAIDAKLLIEVEKEYQNLLNKHDVVVMVWSECPYCKAFKRVLNLKGVKYHHHDYYTDFYKQTKEAWREITKRRTGSTSVPKIFIKGEYVGDFFKSVDFSEVNLKATGESFFDILGLENDDTRMKLQPALVDKLKKVKAVEA